MPAVAARRNRGAYRSCEVVVAYLDRIGVGQNNIAVRIGEYRYCSHEIAARIIAAAKALFGRFQPKALTHSLIKRHVDLAALLGVGTYQQRHEHDDEH